MSTINKIWSAKMYKGRFDNKQTKMYCQALILLWTQFVAAIKFGFNPNKDFIIKYKEDLIFMET